MRVEALPSHDGPIQQVRLTSGRETIAQLDLSWEQAQGGWRLKQEVASLMSGGQLVARATIRLHLREAESEPVAIRAVQSSLLFAARLVLPDVAYAATTGCGTGVLRTTAGFVALVATAPTTVTGIGAVAWLAGWGVWTADLIDTAKACSHKDDIPADSGFTYMGAFVGDDGATYYLWVPDSSLVGDPALASMDYTGGLTP